MDIFKNVNSGGVVPPEHREESEVCITETDIMNRELMEEIVKCAKYSMCTVNEAYVLLKNSDDIGFDAKVIRKLFNKGSSILTVARILQKLK